MLRKKQREQEYLVPIIPSLYSRVSTDEQATNTSLSEQIARATEFVRAHPEMAGIYEKYILREDESGMKIDRPQLNLLRHWIRTGEINAVVVYSSDRLSRRPGHAEELFDEMLHYGARLFIIMHGREFHLDNPTDRQMLLMEMGFNRQWHWMITETMKRGKSGKAKRGGGMYIGTGYCKYGYKKVNYSRGPGSRGHDTYLEIDDEEAAVIQSIFSWLVLERIGTSEILRKLRGIPTPIERNPMNPEKVGNLKRRKPGEWHFSSLYRILRDETYTGKLVQHISGEEYEVAVPAIISRDIWEEAQRLLDEGKKTSKRNTKHEFLVARRIRCQCGYAMRTQVTWSKTKAGKKDYYYYVCGTIRGAPGGYCGLPQFRREVTDDVVWGWVCDVVQDPRSLRVKLEESKAEIDARNASIYARLTQIEETRRRHENKVDMMLEVYTPEQVRTNPDIRAMFVRLRDETTSLLQELREEEEKLRMELGEVTISDEYIRRWEKHAYRIKAHIHEFTYEERREAIESLNITTTCAFEDGRKVLYLHAWERQVDIIDLDDYVANSHPC